MDELGEINVATARPAATRSGGHDQLVMEEDFGVQVVPFISVQLLRSRDGEIESSIPQSCDLCGGSRLVHMHDRARILAGKMADDRWEKGRRHGRHAPDPHLAGGRIGQELDFSDPLLQLIEHRGPAFDQRVSVDRWPDALRASIEKPSPERPFKIADRFRYRGLFHAQLRGRLGHTACLHYGKKYMQVAQPQASADPAFPIDRSGHRFSSIGIEANWVFLLYQHRLALQLDGADVQRGLGQWHASKVRGLCRPRPSDWDLPAARRAKPTHRGRSP